jgi:hypothetical protein
MAAVRRVYIYVVCGVSLAMFLVGLGNGGGALIEALTAGSLAATFRQTLALSAALILVGLPVWILHWRKALRLGTSDPDEQAAALRRLYFFVVTAFLLVAIAALGMRLIDATLGSAFDLRGLVDLGSAARAGWHLIIVTVFWLYHIRLDLKERLVAGETGAASALRRLYLYGAAALLFWLSAWLASELIASIVRPILPGGRLPDLASLAQTAWGLLIALTFWAYHLHIAAANRRHVGEHDASATLRRWYTYAIQFFALATLLVGLRELATNIALHLVPAPVQPDTALAAMLSTTMVACTAWLGHLRWSARGTIGEEDRDSTLRAVANFGILFLSVLVALFSASRVFYLLLTASFHVDAPRWMGSSSLADGLIETLTYVLVFGAAWLAVRRWMGTDALGTDGERQAGVRRLYTHLVSFVGVLALASGASGLLWTLLDQATSNGLAVRSDAWLDQASLFASLLAVGLVAWLTHWRPNPSAIERVAFSRRLYLVVSLLVAVLTLLASGASVLERALSAVMGAGAGVPTLTLTQSISVGVVALALAGYHWRVLAQDNAVRSRQAEPDGEPPSVVSAPGRLLVEIIGANEGDVRRALASLPNGASYSISSAARA